MRKIEDYLHELRLAQHVNTPLKTKLYQVNILVLLRTWQDLEIFSMTASMIQLPMGFTNNSLPKSVILDRIVRTKIITLARAITLPVPILTPIFILVYHDKQYRNQGRGRGGNVLKIRKILTEYRCNRSLVGIGVKS